MMNLCVSIIGILLFVATRCADSLECYTCSDVSNIDDCLTTSQCRTGQSCFANSVTSGQSTRYTLGCTNNNQCGIQSSIVGRDISERETQCHECCSTERCNNLLCVHFKPTTCIDDAKVDCAYMNAMFNICKDVLHSKAVCPKFCGLCSLVDGNWAGWSQWSACDVTCESGLQTRKRTCTDPAPANKGLDCVGNGTETKECVKQTCPIHGGWTKWAEWGHCSVSCEIGIQKRSRTCTNPYPSLYGDHCFGEAMEDRLCEPGPCANGGWSNWGTWTKCSADCDGGLRSRSRNCTNPVPSPLGRFCDGEPSEVEACGKDSCAPEPHVFLAHGISDSTPTAGQTLIFPTILVNKGGDYDKSNGIFTAPFNGSYSLSLQLCFSNQKSLYISIVVENKAYSNVYLYDYYNHVCHTSEIDVHLKKNERVWVKCTRSDSGASLFDDSNHFTFFSGAFIRG